MLVGLVLLGSLTAIGPGLGSRTLLRTGALLVAMAAVYILLDRLLLFFLPTVNPWVGAAFANLPPIALLLVGAPGGAVFGVGEGQIAAIAYLGVALVITAVRGDGGCEVMAIPGLFFRERTRLACILFSPLDWIEARISGGRGER